MSENLAGLLPPLSTEEFAALRADIKAHGVRDAVIVDEHGEVLDGNHRLKIDPKAPKRVVKGLSDGEKEAFVYRCNFVRRNLSPDQKREVHRRMKETAAKLREEDAKKWTQRAVAEVLGIDQSTVSIWNTKTTTNMKCHNGSKRTSPDARVKVKAAAKPLVAKRIASGETQAQVASDLGISQQAVSKIVKAEEKKLAAESNRKARAKELESLEVDGFYHGDFREVAKTIPNGSVDLIFTDPPYDRKTLPLYGELAAIAKKKLIPGGSLICYLGQFQMDKVLELVTPHLRLWWTLAVYYSQGPFARMTEYGVIVKWKPLLWFVNGTRGDKLTYIEDVVDSPIQQKEHHPWQQSMTEATYYIEKLTPKGGMVFDPFCGGGTTAVACAELKRRCITCDIDGEALALAKGRMA